MNKEEAKVRIDELRKIIESHNYNYYILAQPTISDYDFDMLLNELISLEKQYPEFITADSPTQRVGGDITKEFQTVKHRYPMLSLGNTYDISKPDPNFDTARQKIVENILLDTRNQRSAADMGRMICKKVLKSPEPSM